MWFIGQKVVCVESFYGSPQCHPATVLPDIGSIYTIRGVRCFDCVYLLFQELKNPPVGRDESGKPIEQAFQSLGFRPLVERKTDISVFQTILDKQNGSKVGKAAPPSKVFIG